MKHISLHIANSIFIAFSVLIFVLGCTKPTPFGEELLDNQLGEFIYTDTLTMQCTLIPEDSLITSDRSSTADYFLCGELSDPVFGHARSDIYTLFRMSTLGPNFKDASVDSIIMFLRYDANGFYGDTLQPQTLKVHRLASDTSIRWDANYYAHNALGTGQLLGEVNNFMPTPNIGAALFDTTRKAPYLRIPLDNAFGQELLDIDSLKMTADTLFWSVLRGLRISAGAAGSPGAIMAFNLNNSEFSRIRLYYKLATDTSSNSRTFDFYFVGGNKFTNYTHDYSGSFVAPYLNQQTDDLMFVQGMGGLRLKVEFPYAHLLDNLAVNKAEMELTVASVPGDNPVLVPADQLVLTRTVGDTTISFTNDVLFSLGSALNGGFDAFGGFPQTETDNGMSVERYRLTLTRRFQAIVDNASGKLSEQTVFINVYPQSRRASRAIFYGPKNATFPAKLTLKYTKVQ